MNSAKSQNPGDNDMYSYPKNTIAFIISLFVLLPAVLTTDARGGDSQMIISPAEELISVHRPGVTENYGGLQSVYFTPPEERWLSGIDINGSFFFDGADYGYYRWGGYLDPVADVDSFCNVEIRFSNTVTQMAYRYVRGWDPNYGYGGYKEVPFTAWDIANNRQINIAFVEWTESSVFDETWGPSGDLGELGGREYLFILNSDYSGDDPGSAPIDYQGLNIALDDEYFDILYFLWPKLENGHTAGELDDGQKLVFSDENILPDITETVPDQNQLGVPLTQNINITLDIRIDPASITDAAFNIRGNLGGYYSGTFSFFNNNMSVLFTPDKAFYAGETITSWAGNNICSGEGFQMESAYSWSFITSTQASGAAFGSLITYLANSTPHSISAADFDGDSDIDLAATNENSNTVSVLLNDGDGNFSSPVTYEVGDNPVNLIAADFNHDYAVDIATANYDLNSIAVTLNNGDGSFGSPNFYDVGDGPTGLAAADIDGDGDLDIVSANRDASPGSFSALTNNGNGTFSPHWYMRDYECVAGPICINATDFDDDGCPDVVVGCVDGKIRVLHNWGDGAFYKVYELEGDNYPGGIIAADLDSDGDNDIATVNWESDVASIYLNMESVIHEAYGVYSAGDCPYTLCAGDFDGDNDIDLAAACIHSNCISFLFNNGDATFAPFTTGPQGNYPHAVTAADINGDGDLDIISGGDNVAVMLNDDQTSTESQHRATLGQFLLSQNYPNPFNPTTLITYTLNTRSHVNLAIYDIVGRKIKVLVNEFKPAGEHAVQWDATNADGDPVSSGIYFYRINSGNDVGTKKMLRLK
jgi:hypothetical protein